MTNSKPRLLVLSNMWPSNEKPYSGIFVRNQVERYASDDRVEVCCHFLKRSFTGIAKSSIKYFLFFASFVARYLFRRFDVVHVHYFFPTVILGVLYKILHPGTLLVVTFHGTDVTHFMERGTLRLLGKWLIQYVDIGISVSESMASKVKAALDFESHYVFSAGVRDDVFYPLVDAQKNFDFIFVGSFIKRKGVDILVEALNQIDTSRMIVAFVGSGELLGEIRNLDGFHKIALFENLTQDELREVFATSRFLVLPSRYEPFGLVVSEAMFCGVPVIGTSVGGIPAQISDGINGRLIDSEDVDALKQALVDAFGLAEERYKEMVESCLQANKENAISVICEEQMQIYTAGVARRRGSP